MSQVQFFGSETIKKRARALSKLKTDEYHQNRKLNRAVFLPASNRKVD